MKKLLQKSNEERLGLGSDDEFLAEDMFAVPGEDELTWDERIDFIITEKALLNILDDYSEEKILMQNTEAALLNILDDYGEDKRKMEMLNYDLLSANSKLKHFAYVASHDLQEPLRMVASFTQLLEKKYKDKLDQDANDYIKFTVEGATRMQKLIDDLLLYSRITSRGRDFEDVDTSKVFELALQNLQMLIQDTNAEVTSGNLPMVKADEFQLVQLFQNLIGNALKYRKKSVAPKIHISCKSRDDFFEFAVKDNGIGIDMKYHDKVFIIFQRLHSKDEYSGTGIGLSICKHIAERHQGKIWFESIENEGTTFYFTIKKF